MLLNFQKEAIWRQIQEYKRANVRAQERIEQLKVHQVGYDERLSELDSHWSKVTMPSVFIHECRIQMRGQCVSQRNN